MTNTAPSLLDNLSIKLYADGADFDSMVELAKQPYIKGFTTNPSFMRKSGISDYEKFGREILVALSNHPISLEVFADDLETMEKQAHYIATWGANVNVKIPVTNTKGEFTGPILSALSKKGITLNVTAIMTPQQVRQVAQALAPNASAIISVFAGRAADAGIDPVPLMQECADILSAYPKQELLWASTRETFNIFQADAANCKIITVPHGILHKLHLLGKDLNEYSLDTVKTFHKDAASAGYELAMPISAD